MHVIHCSTTQRIPDHFEKEKGRGEECVVDC